MPDGRKRKNRARDFSLGRGLAERARKAILTREDKIDAQVAAATERRRKAQTTDSNN